MLGNYDCACPDPVLIRKHKTVEFVFCDVTSLFSYNCSNLVIRHTQTLQYIFLTVFKTKLAVDNPYW